MELSLPVEPEPHLRKELGMDLSVVPVVLPDVGGDEAVGGGERAIPERLVGGDVLERHVQVVGSEREEHVRNGNAERRHAHQRRQQVEQQAERRREAAIGGGHLQVVHVGVEHAQQDVRAEGAAPHAQTARRQQEEEEERGVVCAHVVVDPGAVVVEAHHAALADVAVLGAARFDLLAGEAELVGRIQQRLAQQVFAALLARWRRRRRCPVRGCGDGARVGGRCGHEAEQRDAEEEVRGQLPAERKEGQQAQRRPLVATADEHHVEAGEKGVQRPAAVVVRLKPASPSSFAADPEEHTAKPARKQQHEMAQLAHAPVGMEVALAKQENVHKRSNEAQKDAANQHHNEREGKKAFSLARSR